MADVALWERRCLSMLIATEKSLQGFSSLMCGRSAEHLLPPVAKDAINDTVSQYKQ